MIIDIIVSLRNVKQAYKMSLFDRNNACFRIEKHTNRRFNKIQKKPLKNMFVHANLKGLNRRQREVYSCKGYLSER